MTVSSLRWFILLFIACLFVQWSIFRIKHQNSPKPHKCHQFFLYVMLYNSELYLQTLFFVSNTLLLCLSHINLVKVYFLGINLNFGQTQLSLQSHQFSVKLPFSALFWSCYRVRLGHLFSVILIILYIETLPTF